MEQVLALRRPYDNVVRVVVENATAAGFEIAHSPVVFCDDWEVGQADAAGPGGFRNGDPERNIVGAVSRQDHEYLRDGIVGFVCVIDPKGPSKVVVIVVVMLCGARGVRHRGVGGGGGSYQLDRFQEGQYIVGGYIGATPTPAAAVEEERIFAPTSEWEGLVIMVNAPFVQPVGVSDRARRFHLTEDPQIEAGQAQQREEEAKDKQFQGGHVYGEGGIQVRASGRTRIEKQMGRIGVVAAAVRTTTVGLIVVARLEEGDTPVHVQKDQGSDALVASPDGGGGGVGGRRSSSDDAQSRSNGGMVRQIRCNGNRCDNVRVHGMCTRLVDIKDESRHKHPKEGQGGKRPQRDDRPCEECKETPYAACPQADRLIGVVVDVDVVVGIVMVLVVVVVFVFVAVVLAFVVVVAGVVAVDSVCPLSVLVCRILFRRLRVFRCHRRGRPGNSRVLDGVDGAVVDGRRTTQRSLITSRWPSH